MNENDIRQLYDETNQNALSNLSKNEREKNHEQLLETENKARFLKAIDDIAYNTERIDTLTAELSAERARAEKAEKRTRVVTVLLSILACLSSYALEHHKEIIAFFLSFFQ